MSDPAEKRIGQFSTDDLRDLQVWNNLTWMHELLFEQDTELAEFRRKGAGWSEAEKHWLLDRQRQIMADIIPLHRKLSEAGQVELTTTPFYHPILPLLWDKRSARQAMASCELPRHTDPYPEDVARHLAAAVECHEHYFGCKPKGMWPSEGSVSQDIIEAIANVGIQWIATDEEILSCSLNGQVARDAQGFVNRPDKLYQPWRVSSGNRSLDIIFRDHGLSDQIGFHYQRSDPVWAAGDLLDRVASIGRAVAHAQSDRPALVPIILDGENCWEYYADGGVKFLRQLYRDAARRNDVAPRTVSEHLQLSPSVDSIPQLFAGSWIFHNFAIWIGHAEDRAAWDLLHETRHFLKLAEKAGRHTPERLKLAWRELDIAEGSDWFWWYGDDHSSELDSLFDQLFRRHLENVYTLLGQTPPVSLARPIGGTRERVAYTRPTGLLDVNVDGRISSFFEWRGAGRHVAGNQRGTMALVSEGIIKELHFGFDAENLYVRIDTGSEANSALADIDSLRLRFIEPKEMELVVDGWQKSLLHCDLLGNGKPHPPLTCHTVAHDVVETQVPLHVLDVKPGCSLSFFVELFKEGQSLDRAPVEGCIDCEVPGPEFDSLQWQV
ncbi:MAG: glycoside hydrolase family 57 protein [Planctomycetaceae bacterium]